MMNPEAGAALAVSANDQQSRWEMLRENMRGDEGFIALGGIKVAIDVMRRSANIVHGSKPLQKVIAGAAGLTLVAGLGFMHNLAGRFSGEHDINVSAPPAEYEGSFVYEMPVTCWGGYDSRVSPESIYDYKINTDVPDIIPFIPDTITTDTYYKFGVKLESENTNILCTKATAISGEQAVQGGDVEVALKKDDFSSYIYPTNPLADKVTTSNGLLGMAQKIFEDAIKGANDLPLVGNATQHVDVSSSDDLNSVLLGYDRMIGNMQSTKECSKLAWNDLREPDGPLVQSIQEAVAKLRGVSPDKVHVRLPATLDLKDQYEPKYQQIMQTAAATDGTLNLQLPTNISCVASPNHNQVVMVPANAEDVTGKA